MKMCTKCEEEISEARLKALPDVKVCVDCQQEAERKGQFQRHQIKQEIRFRGEEIESCENVVVRASG